MVSSVRRSRCSMARWRRFSSPSAFGRLRPRRLRRGLVRRLRWLRMEDGFVFSSNSSSSSSSSSRRSSGSSGGGSSSSRRRRRSGGISSSGAAGLRVAARTRGIGKGCPFASLTFPLALVLSLDVVAVALLWGTWSAWPVPGYRMRASLPFSLAGGFAGSSGSGRRRPPVRLPRPRLRGIGAATTRTTTRTRCRSRRRAAGRTLTAT